jgi:hypothetical protein
MSFLTILNNKELTTALYQMLVFLYRIITDYSGRIDQIPLYIHDLTYAFPWFIRLILESTPREPRAAGANPVDASDRGAGQLGLHRLLLGHDRETQGDSDGRR